MILTAKGQVLAHQNAEMTKIQARDGSYNLATIDQIQDKVARAAFGRHDENTLASFIGPIEATFEFNDEPFVSTIIPHVDQSIPWFIAIYAAEADFIGGLKANRTRNIWIAVLVAGLTGIIGLLLSNRILRPVREFSLQAEQAASGSTRHTYRELQGAQDTLKQEIEMRKSFESEYGQTFDLAPRGMAQLTHDDGRFLKVNAKVLDILGYSETEALDLRLIQILHPDEIASFTLVNEAPAADVYNHERRYVRKAEEKISALRRDLSQFTRVDIMGQMATGLAHELNQPLTAITQNVDAALSIANDEKNQNSELIDVLNQLDAQAHRGGEIIHALRGFVRKDAGEVEAFDLGNLVAQTLRLVQPETKAHRVQVNVSPTRTSPVRANRIQVAQVLINLLRNAIEAISTADSDARTIDIVMTEIDDKLQFQIDDTGGGIDPDINLFTHFETSKQKGMGVGLAFSRSLIEANDGLLWHDNNNRKTTRFCFTLPLALKADKQAAE